MAYRGPASAARKTIETPSVSKAARAQDKATKAIRRAIREGVGARNTAGYGATAVATVLPPVKYELDRNKLSARSIAQLLGETALRIRSKDVSEAYLGLNALRLAVKIRGDLLPANAPQSMQAPANVNVLIQVLREMSGQSEPATVDVTPDPDRKVT